ncbi:hypothetical protein BKA61DRAFT_680767 [Leptodontidium sp. MPI-SDFR-AT-0119]|nr:hypothetical protein BKA61DRAFT_680767 [Leptodontidium sp. MPI-SDFR-AT-0119]
MAGRGGNGGGRGKGRGGGGGGGGGRDGAGAKTCNICHKVGHIAADCRSAGKTFKCTNCNMNNHTTADCTKGAKNGEKKGEKRGDKRGDKKGDNSHAPSKGKVSRPCRFCQELHLDRDCPTKGGKGSSFGETRGDTRMRDVFGTPEFSPPCQYCGGQHFSTDCPKIPHQLADQYQYQRYPSQPAPAKSLWDTCDDIHEEFVSGDPWGAATTYGPVDANDFPTFYTQPIVTSLYLQQQQRRDIEGDIIMDWF